MTTGDPAIVASAGAGPAHPSARLAVAAFVAMATIYFFSYFQRAAIPGTIFNQLQHDVGMSAVAVAALGSMFTWIYGSTQLVVGLLADRFGGVRTLLGGGVVMLAGSVLFPLAREPELLFAARVLTGLGASFMYLSIVRELDRLFGHRHFTVWVGVLLAVGYSGAVAATLPFERAAAAFGWREALLGVAGLLALALLAAGMILRRWGHEPRGKPSWSLAPLAELCRNRRAYPLLASGLIMFPILFVMQTVLGKKFLQDFVGLSSPAAAWFVLIMAIVSACSVLLGGYLPRLFHDRRRPAFLVGAASLMLGTGVLLTGALTGAPGWVFLAGYLLLGLSGAGNPASTTIMKELNSPETVAAALALLNSLAYIGCGTVGQIGGLILQAFQDRAQASAGGWVYPPVAYVALFAFLAGLAALNAVFAWRTPESGGQRPHLVAGTELAEFIQPAKGAHREA